MNDDGKIVWYSTENDTVYTEYWDGSTVTRISNNNATGGFWPKINNRGHVMWPNSTWGDPADHANFREIYFWDGFDTYRITNNTRQDREAQMNNNDQIVWMSSIFGVSGSTDIHFIDLNGLIEPNTGPVLNIGTEEYFNQIQAAIDDPDTLDGHVIEVSAGQYNETLLVNKSLDIRGAGAGSTVINGDGVNDVVYCQSSSVKISGFTLRNGSDGLRATVCFGCEFRDLVIEGNWQFGVFLFMTHDSVVEDNYVANHTDGVLVVSSDGNTISGNTVLGNDYGIYLATACTGNRIFHNRILNNTLQGYDDTPGSNEWDNGYPSGGNFWTDYNGTDMFTGPNQDQPGSDGLGDTPYPISGGTMLDRYPLMGDYVEEGFNVSLDEGWNLVSVPLAQDDESIADVLGSIDGKWDYLMAYDPLSPEPWESYATFRPGSLNDDIQISHRNGFWLNVTEPNATLSVRGITSPYTQIPLFAGWNLVGYPSLANETVGNSLWGTGADMVMVGDTSEPGNLRQVDPTYLMKPGEGYWIHIPADTVWIVDW